MSTPYYDKPNQEVVQTNDPGAPVSPAAQDNPCLAAPAIVSQPQIDDACAEVVSFTAQLLTRISAWIEGEIQELGGLAGQAIGKLMQWICKETDEVCAVPGQLHNHIQVVIEQRCANVQAVCDQYAPYIKLAAKAARKKSPCAEPTQVGAPLPVQSPVTAGSVPVLTSDEIGAVSPLAGLWLPSGADGVAVELAALPAEMWDQQSPQGWYLTLTQDVNSKCGAPVLKQSADSCSVVGTLWVATAMALPNGCCEEVLRLLGVPDDAITSAPAEFTSTPAPQSDKSGLPVSLPSLPALPDFGAIVVKLQTLATDLEAFFRWLRQQWEAIVEWWRTHVPPTKEQLCALLGPVYGQMMIPVGARPFCDNLPDFIMGKLREAGIGG